MPRTPRQEISLNLEQANNNLDRAISEDAKSLQIVLLYLQQSQEQGTDFPEAYQELGDSLSGMIELLQECKNAHKIIRDLLDK